MFAVSVCPSRCLARLRCAKTAGQIMILFGVNTLGSPRNIVLDGGLDPPLTHRAGGEFDAILLWPLVDID